jgi:hypothetical protein
MCFTVPINRTTHRGNSSHSLLLVDFAFLCSCSSECYSLLSPSLLVWLPMARVKHTQRLIGGEALLEATDVTSQELTEALSSQMQGSKDAALFLSHRGSLANTGDSNGESRSTNSDDELTASDSDSMKRAKVTVATATTEMTFDFGAYNVGKVRVWVIECFSFFPKGHTRSPGSKTVPTPWAGKTVVF